MNQNKLLYNIVKIAEVKKQDRLSRIFGEIQNALANGNIRINVRPNEKGIRDPKSVEVAERFNTEQENKRLMKNLQTCRKVQKKFLQRQIKLHQSDH